MRTNDFDLSEIDYLISKSERRSLDPEPGKQPGMHPAVLKDLISDHLRALRHMNRYLQGSAELDAAISTLEDGYAKIFGRSLTELSDNGVKPAVLELRRELKKLSKEEDPDLSYRSIDRIMRKICKQHDCKPHALHDAFVSTFDATPDEWIRQLIKE